MGIRDVLARAVGGGDGWAALSRTVVEGKATGGLLTFGLEGAPQYPAADYAGNARAGYEKSDIVYACIMERATTAPQAVLRVYDADGEEVPDHPLRAVVARPNPLMSEFELFELTIIHLDLAGNAFWEKVRDRTGRVVELWPLRPDRVEIIPSPRRGVGGYVYRLGAETYTYPAEDIVHFKYPAPLNDFWGMPPLRAALRQIATDNEGTDLTKLLLQNRAIPGVVITTQQALDEATTRRLTARWRERFGGNRRGDPAFLQAGMDIKTVGLNMQDLAFPDLRNVAESRICGVFGVPPILISAKVGLDRSTFANYEEARRSFWEETISTLHRRLADRIAADLLIEWDATGTLSVRWDTSGVTALAEYQARTWARARDGWNDDLLTRAEARALIGYPVDDARDQVFKSELTARRVVTVGDDGAAEGQAKRRASATAGVERKAADGLTLLRQVLGRRSAGEAFAEAFTDAARDVFRRIGRDVRAIVDGRKAIDPQEAESIAAALSQASGAWRQMAFDAFAPLLTDAITTAATLAAAEVGIAFNLENPFALEFVQGYTFRFAESLAKTSRDALREVVARAQRDGLTIDELRRALQDEVAAWSDARAEQIARTETIRASNQGAKLAYRQAGITEIEWLAVDDSCPYCKALDGRRVSIDATFLQLGDVFHPEGADAPLVVTYEDIDAPPAHPNCRCTIVPVFEPEMSRDRG